MATSLGTDAPAATRARGPGWRDPRLWVGVAIVAASVVGGARLLASADDTVGVWAAVDRHGAGDQLDDADLTSVRVRFAGADTADAYFTTDDPLPPQLVLSRGVEAGELLPRASIGSATSVDVVEVPIAVEPEQVPGSVDTGAVVDVYLVARVGQGGAGPTDPADTANPATSEPALAGVTVLDAPALAESFGTTGKRQLVLAVPQADAAGFFALLGASQDPVITVVKRG